MNEVYKYCSPRGVRILGTLELKITPPNEFNDPFEFTPHIISSNPRQYANRVLKNKANLKWLYSQLSLDGQFRGSFKEFKRLTSSDRSRFAKGLAECVHFGTESAQKDHLDHISAKLGVLCLSLRRDSILMWGHYCDRHRGLVIGFNNQASIFRAGKGLRPVAYVRERVVFDANWQPGSVAFERYDDSMILSKNIDWRYEEELRQTFQLSALIQRPLEGGNLGHFLQLGPDDIRTVTLGAKCSDQLTNEVRLELSKPQFSHVRLERACLHESEFALVFAAL